MPTKMVDHLFRHQYGKMVATLTKFFGLTHLETIEDAVQDTFIKASLQWRNQLPEHPEAWLTKAAKNRTIDLLRKITAEKNRFEKLSAGSLTTPFNELFLDHEIEDSQLRMIFVACHPDLNSREQIAFALKTIAGFNTREIASGLLTKEETIKKRLQRARKTIQENNIQFEFPAPQELKARINSVLEVIYLVFNEGFHSNQKNTLIRKDLCGEAIRLCKLLLQKESFRSGNVYALFALLCFHASRLESKINNQNEIVDMEHQDRTKWYQPLIVMGNNAMEKAMQYDGLSKYHYEAAIASEHLKAASFTSTNWKKILFWYEQLHQMRSSASTLLNMALVNIQLGQLQEGLNLLKQIQENHLENRMYLLYGAYATYFEKAGNIEEAIAYLNQALLYVTNDLEKDYLIKKRARLINTH